MERKHNNRKPINIIAMSGDNFDPFMQLARLPAGGVFIFRHYALSDRAILAARLVVAARAQKKHLLVAGDTALAYRLEAAGVHYPEWQLKRLQRIERRHPDWLVSAAAHNFPALLRAARLGADWALLSPIFAVRDKSAALGVCRLAHYAHRADLPVYALGGLTTRARIAHAHAAPIAGWAGNRAFCVSN